MIREFFEAKWPNHTQAQRIQRISVRTNLGVRTIENWFNGGHKPSTAARALLLKAYPGLKEVLP